MAISIDHENAGAKSRLVLLLLTTLTLRLMARWRESLVQVLGSEPDYESTIIVGAILSINGEKLMRSDLDLPLQSLDQPLPYDLLTTCNLSSIAATTGLNRETVRRKVNHLISGGVLIKENESLHIGHGLLQLPIASETIEAQLQALTRTVNQLERLQVLRAPQA